MAARKGKPENLKPFKPGQSGNPGGRAKGIERRAREECGDDGDLLIRFWRSLMDDASEKTADRIRCSELLAERGFGRPAQKLTVNDSEPITIHLAFDPHGA